MQNVAKYPRPTLPMNGKNTPLPWVGGNWPERGHWARVKTIRAVEAEKDKLCIVCGLELSDDFIYMRAFKNISDRAPYLFEIMMNTALPSPTYVHPKCGQIAALFCPHLKQNKYPAQTQSGQKLTHDQLKELAHNSDKP